MTQEIRALRDCVLVQFIDETRGEKGAFTEAPTKSGILLRASNAQQKVARWAKVFAVGPKAADDIKPGQFVLIEALMWSNGVMVDDSTKVWMTQPDKILLVADNEGDCTRQ